MPFWARWILFFTRDILACVLDVWARSVTFDIHLWWLFIWLQHSMSSCQMNTLSVPLIKIFNKNIINKQRATVSCHGSIDKRQHFTLLWLTFSRDRFFVRISWQQANPLILLDNLQDRFDLLVLWVFLYYFVMSLFCSFNGISNEMDVLQICLCPFSL